jgi:HD domain-containing protein
MGRVFAHDAIEFASRKHSTQRRKDEEASPYINHPIAVTHLLADTGITDLVTLMAAVLHDTIEDTETTPTELDEHFGQTVRKVVEEMTDDKSLDKAVRKQLQIEHAPNLSQQAKAIKLADKIANMRDVMESPRMTGASPDGSSIWIGLKKWWRAAAVRAFGWKSSTTRCSKREERRSRRQYEALGRKWLKRIGEPPRNRTETPQIKSRIPQAKTLEIRIILHGEVANRGVRRQIVATQVQPANRHMGISRARAWRSVALAPSNFNQGDLDLPSATAMLP